MRGGLIAELCLQPGGFDLVAGVLDNQVYKRVFLSRSTGGCGS